MAKHQSGDRQSRFGVSAGFSYTLNSVVGAGFLAIPWAYQNGGWLLSLCMQVVFLLVGWLLSSQLLEITSRVTTLMHADDLSISIWQIIKAGFGCKRHAHTYEFLSPTSQPDIRDDLQFDLYEIVKLLQGRYWAAFYFLCTTAYLLCSLTAYINIFGTGFATHIPIFATCSYSGDAVSDQCRWQYVVCISVFFVLMAYFCSVEFQEQRWMQMPMTLVRLFVIVTIAVLSLLNVEESGSLDGEKYTKDSPPLLDFASIGQTMPVVLFAGIYQPYFPGILQTMKKDPQVLSRVLALVSTALIALYSLLGMAGCFGISKVPMNVSLAFAHYTDGHSAAERPAWTYAIGYLIVLFPAIDVISIFPLLAHAISDNMMSCLYSADRLVVRFTAKLIYYGIRIGCILPAFVYAFFEIRLGKIAKNSGFIAYYLTFFTIPLLHIAARCIVPKPSAYDVRCNPAVLSM